MTKGADDLVYPFSDKPGPGELIEVAPGVNWLRMPLPMALNHINLWMLEDATGWTLVDTGVANDVTRDLWEQVLARHLKGKPVTRLIVTHMHTDHVGLAGWLTERCSVDLWMTSLEYFTCRVLVADTGKQAPKEGLDFYRAAGFDEAALDVYRSRFGMFGSFIGELPQAFNSLADGDRLQLAGQDWQVWVGRGHSPEHACLFCPALNILIAGDQILPRISSNISVRPTEPAANPLLQWLESCQQLQEFLPEDVLVLPSHGYPFRGARQRLQQLIDGHREALEKLHAQCETHRRAIDTFTALFRGQVDAKSLIIATGESLAHLNYLLAKGQLQVATDADGIKWYSTT